LLAIPAFTSEAQNGGPDIHGRDTMTTLRRTGLLGLILLAQHVGLFAGQLAPTGSPAALTPEQMERFLLEAKLVSSRDAGDGITNSLRATFSDGTLTHDVHIQTIDVYRQVVNTPKMSEVNFRDTYRYNVAAYRVARLLGMSNVPMSVERRIRGQRASVTWWIDDVMMDERTRVKRNDSGPDPTRLATQVHVQRVFDELIQNRDRNLGNLVWTSDWTMWLIDHTRAFRLGEGLQKPELLQRCERSLCAALKGLTVDSVRIAVGRSLMSNEIEALVNRAGAIVKHFDRLSVERGEASVMYTLRQPSLLR
jgi:hypothetical protein